jgi:hypothetical protein
MKSLYLKKVYRKSVSILSNNFNCSRVLSNEALGEFDISDKYKLSIRAGFERKDSVNDRIMTERSNHYKRLNLLHMDIEQNKQSVNTLKEIITYALSELPPFLVRLGFGDKKLKKKLQNVYTIRTNKEKTSSTGCIIF